MYSAGISPLARPGAPRRVVAHPLVRAVTWDWKWRLSACGTAGQGSNRLGTTRVSWQLWQDITNPNVSEIDTGARSQWLGGIIVTQDQAIKLGSRWRTAGLLVHEQLGAQQQATGAQ
jgi:hypothetical protein